MNHHGNSTAANNGNTDTGDTLEAMELHTPPGSPSDLPTTAPGSGVKRTISDRKKDELEGAAGLLIKREIMDDNQSPDSQGRQKIVHNTTVTTMHSLGNNNIIHGNVVNATSTVPNGNTNSSPASYATDDLYGPDINSDAMDIDNNSVAPSIIRTATANTTGNARKPKGKSISFDVPPTNNTAISTVFQEVLEAQHQRYSTYNPNEGEQTPKDYATAVHSPTQTKITEPVIIHKKYSFRLMWSFHVKHQKAQYIMARKRKGEILQHAIRQLLRAGMETTEEFAINTWDERSKLHTLQKLEDVPSDYDTLIKYVRHPDKGGIRQGDTNHNWGINVTSDVCMKHFIGYWDELRPYKKRPNHLYFPTHPSGTPPIHRMA